MKTLKIRFSLRVIKNKILKYYKKYTNLLMYIFIIKLRFENF